MSVGPPRLPSSLGSALTAILEDMRRTIAKVRSTPSRNWVGSQLAHCPARVDGCHLTCGMTPMSMTKTQIYFPPAELAALHRVAKKTGRAVADLVREAVRTRWLSTCISRRPGSAAWSDQRRTLPPHRSCAPHPDVRVSPTPSVSLPFALWCLYVDGFTRARLASVGRNGPARAAAASG
jgi:hypothetical protein